MGKKAAINVCTKKNHGFKMKYVYGGAGIFDSLASFLRSYLLVELDSRWKGGGKENSD